MDKAALIAAFKRLWLNVVNYVAAEVNNITQKIETLDKKVDSGVKTLNERIDGEVETLNERIDSEVETLNETIVNRTIWYYYDQE